MTGGEIKNVLTLDVSKFTSALDRATSDLQSLDKQLKGVAKVVDTFEKSTNTLGGDISKAANNFRLLDQTIAALATKLGAVATNGFESVSNRSRKAKKDVDDFNKSVAQSGSALLSMSDWTKRYGASLDMLKPSLKSATQGQQELTKAQQDTAKAANLSAAEQIKAKIKALEAEKENNAKIIAEKQKLASELAAIEQRIRAESLGRKVNADNIERRIGAYGGKNKIAVEMAEANRLDTNADWIRRQAQEVTRLTQAIKEKNAAIGQSIVAMRAEHAQAIENEKRQQELALKVLADARKEADAEKDRVKEEARIKRQEERMWRDYEREQRRKAAADARAEARAAAKAAREAAQAAKAAEREEEKKKRDAARAELEEKRRIEREKVAAAKKAAREEAEFNKWIKEEQKKWDREQARAAREAAAERKRAEREVALAAEQAARDQARAARELLAERKRAAREAAAYEKQQAEEVAKMWKSMGQLWVASRVQTGLGQTVSKSSEMQKAQLRVDILGLSAEERKEFDEKAYDLARQEKYLSNIDAINARYTALTSLGKNKVEVIDGTLAEAMRTVQALRVTGFEEGRATDIQRNLYGVAEMRQVINDIDATKRTFDTVFRAISATGGKINVADLETILRNLGPGASQLSDKGVLNLLALAEQMKVSGGHGTGGAGTGVSTVGTMVKMMQLYAAGKPMKLEAIEQFMGAGLMNTDAFKNGDTGFGKRERDALAQVSTKAARSAGLKGVEELMADPLGYLKAIREPLLEYMKKNASVYFDKGADLDSISAQNAAFTKFFARSGFSHRAVAMQVTAMDPRFMERTDNQTNLAMQGDSAAKTIEKARETWAQSVSEMKAGAENLAAAFLPILTPLGAIARGLGSIMNTAAEFVRNNPLVAMFDAGLVAVGGLVLALKGTAGVLGAVGGTLGPVRALMTGFSASAGTAASVMSSLRAGVLAAGLAFPALIGVLGKVVAPFAAVAAGATASLGWLGRLSAGILGFVAKWASPVGWAILAGQLGWVVAKWVYDLEIGGLTIGERIKNIFLTIEVGWKNTLLDIREKWLDFKKFIGGDGFFGESAERKELNAERAALNEYAKKMRVQARQPEKTEKPKEQKPPTPPQQPSTLSDVTGAEGFSVGGGDKSKQYRQFENAFARQFYSAETRAAIEQLKLDGMIAGNSTFEEQARQEVIKLWMGGDLDDGKDPNKRKFLKGATYGKDGRVKLNGRGYDPLKPWGVDQMDWDAKFEVGTEADGKTPIKKSLNDLTAEIATRKGLLEAVKATTFATERASAADVEANNAAARLADGGLAKKSEAMRALEREFEREEKRTGVLNRNKNGEYENPKQAEEYLRRKRAATAAQARADLANYAADTIAQTKELNAEVLTTERERLLASQEAVRRSEDAKWRAIKETFDKELAALDAGTEKHAEMLATKEAAERRHNEYLAALRKKQEREMMTPLQRMAEEWRDVYQQIGQLEVNWANGFIDTLHNVITTGKGDWRSFVLSMGNELSKMLLKNALAGPVESLMSGVGNTLRGWLTQGGTQAAGGAVAGAATNAAAQAGGAAAGAAAQAAAANAASTAIQTLGQASSVANLAMTQMVSQGISASTQSLIQSVIQSGVSLTAEQSTSLAMLVLGESALQAAAALAAISAQQATSSVLAFAKNGAYFDGGLSFFANGGTFTNSVVDSPTLFKFANGGQFGVMGEAGPEAIMPLRRGPDGSLGVQVHGAQIERESLGGQTVNISIVVNNPENSSTDKQQTSGNTSDMDVWNRLATRVKAAVRDELVSQQRPGGVLYR